MNWDDLRFFVAVARMGGLTGAAAALRTSPQTVGRHVGSLEASLATLLFVRGPTGYRLTQDGVLLLAHAEKVEEELAALQAGLKDRHSGLAGTVTIAAPENLAVHILLPGLKALMDQHPRLRIEILTAVATVGMARGEADLALRLVRPEAGALSIQRVATLGYGLYAASAYVDALGGADANFLSDARLVGWDGAHDHLSAARWLAAASGRRPDLALSSLAAQVAAVRAGYGVALIPCSLADGLRRLPAKEEPAEPLWLVSHSHDLGPERVTMVKKEIIGLVAAARRRLEHGGES